MITPRRWPTAFRRSFAVLAGCAAVWLAGCASEKEHRLAQLDKSRDPLMGKIPSPNVPTGRDQYGAKDTRDPLLRADAREVTADPYRPATDRRPAAVSTGRDLTLGTTATADQLAAELQQIGAKVYGPTRTETGSYEAKVMVPSGPSGAMSGYVGGGATPTAALRDAYDQVRAGWR